MRSQAINYIVDVKVTDFVRARVEVAAAEHARDVAELMMAKACA